MGYQRDWVGGQGDPPQLSSHPNFKFPKFRKGESDSDYALRCAAALISPPQEPGESQEIECVDAARQILDLRRRVRWELAHAGSDPDERW